MSDSAEAAPGGRPGSRTEQTAGSRDRAAGGPVDQGAPEHPRRGGVGWFGWAFLIALWGYAVYRLGSLWYANEAYSFGWFMPLLCLLLFWERWKCRPRREPVRAGVGTFLLTGLLAGLLAVALLILEVIPIGRLAAWLFALVVCALSIIALYCIGGRSYSRHFVFPLLFFLIAVPWPLRYEVPLIRTLSEWNAGISARLANHLGTPAIRSGVLIETGAGLVGVDDACSGIRSFQASVMVGLFLGELFRYGLLRRLVLLVGGVSIAFLCNVARTTFLVRTCDLKGLDAVNLYHDRAGFTILGITFAGLLALAWLLRRRRGADAKPGWREQLRQARAGATRPAAPAPAAAPDASQPASPAAPGGAETRGAGGTTGVLPGITPAWQLRVALAAVLVWVVLVEAGMELWFGVGSRRYALTPAWSFRLPEQNPEFRRLPISPKVRGLLRFDEGQRAEWRDAAGRVWQLYYLEWKPARNRYGATTADAQQLGHTTDICLVNTGMKLQTNLPMRVIEAGGVRWMVTQDRLLDRGRTFHLFSAHWKPRMNDATWQPALHQSGSRLRLVAHAIRARDRDDQGQRMIKVGVWEMDSDEAAEQAFRDYLASMVVGPATAGVGGQPQSK